MNRGTWKSVERKLAAMLGGVRIPVSGRTRGDKPDIAHKSLSLEVKCRKRIPVLLKDAMDQAEKSVRGEQVPVVIVHEHGKRHNNDYVVIKLRDFLDMEGVVGEVDGL